jgi:hypothetical protein
MEPGKGSGPVKLRHDREVRGLFDTHQLRIPVLSSGPANSPGDGGAPRD